MSHSTTNSSDTACTPAPGAPNLLAAQTIEVNKSNLYSIGGNQYNTYVTNHVNDSDQGRFPPGLMNVLSAGTSATFVSVLNIP